MHAGEAVAERALHGGPQLAPLQWSVSERAGSAPLEVIRGAEGDQGQYRALIPAIQC